MTERRILVVGARGMLGRAVADELANQGIAYLADTHYINSSADAALTLEAAREAGQGLTHIINCAGALDAFGKPQRAEPTRMIFANAYLPACLAGLAGDALLIHVSTDCVFDEDGPSGSYHVSARPSPAANDFYGQTKALGELAVRAESSDALIVRTSFIGSEHGLLRWLLSQEPDSTIKGFLHAFWSGSTVYEVARQLVGLTAPGSHSSGMSVVHLATTEPWSKYRLLKRLVQIFDLNVKIEPSRFPVINRALEPTRTIADLDDRRVAAELRLRANAPAEVTFAP